MLLAATRVSPLNGISCPTALAGCTSVTDIQTNDQDEPSYGNICRNGRKRWMLSATMPNNSNRHDNVYDAIIMAGSLRLCESSPDSCDECRTAQCGNRPLDQANCCSVHLTHYKTERSYGWSLVSHVSRKRIVLNNTRDGEMQQQMKNHTKYVTEIHNWKQVQQR